MNRLCSVMAAALAALPTAAWAFEPEGRSVGTSETGWLDAQLESVRRAGDALASSFDWSGAKVWGRGLRDSDDLRPVPPSDKAVGARFRPFRDIDFVIGTEVSRATPENRSLRSELNWQMSWSREWGRLKGLSVGLGTRGAVESAHGGVWQSVNGQVGLKLASQSNWNAQVRVSPQVDLDVLHGTWRPRLSPELVSETVLNSSAAPLKSLLNLRVGYELAPDARPSASARVEFRLVPRF
jgi:hypothetical protein